MHGRAKIQQSPRQNICYHFNKSYLSFFSMRIFYLLDHTRVDCV